VRLVRCLEPSIKGNEAKVMQEDLGIGILFNNILFDK
jgi:hypothetical protein